MGTPLNPPNFASGSNGVTFSVKGSHANKAGDVERIYNSVGNWRSGEVKSIYLRAQGPAAAGSCSFAGGTGIDLSALPLGNYEWPGITEISSSGAEVFVFKN